MKWPQPNSTLGWGDGFIRYRNDPIGVDLVFTSRTPQVSVFLGHKEMPGTRVSAQEQGVTMHPETWNKLVDTVRQSDPVRVELRRERDEWKRRAEERLSPAGVGALSGVHRAAIAERAKYPAEAQEFHKSIDALQRAAIDAVYDENDSGGHARQVVGDVARILGVDIDEGPGHRWDPDHMARVVAAATDLLDQRNTATEQAELWKSLAERQDNTAPIRTELRAAERERDDLRRQLAYERLKTESLSERATDDEVEELKAVIVSQARETTRLKGESE